ncbi:MAG: topoisomerase IV [Clostridia bacterium]|nr:topoisomerase IV [Clostridia bacterium]
MAKKKKTDIQTEVIEAEIKDQLIVDTLETNYMPYAMSVILSRAIPEIDGFKPAHRKLLYSMYKMGLLEGDRAKSARVCGETMKLNPHGDSSIYETLVRLTRANEALLHPFIDSKGSFGKQYSRDTAPAASRYTECKLAPICREILGGINKNAVDMVDNYDGTMKEPALMPTAFPNILVAANTGIAVGMATNICSFNLAEVCDGTTELIKNPKTTPDRMLDIIKGPDFPLGAQLVFDRDKMRAIYETGVGSFTLRSKYAYDKENNCIDVTEIPYSTSIEKIIEEITKGVTDGKIKELSDVRDETGFDGFRLTLDLKRGVDPDKLMTKLFKLTSLQDSFACNFNIIVDKKPVVLGVNGILLEWIRFRTGCVRRELEFDLNAKRDKLHLLLGLGKILLDIDKAIAIVRGTEKEADVVPNLQKAFDLTEIQAEYVAEIKLRYLNREYILNRVKEISSLQAEIKDIEDTIKSDRRVKDIIVKQLAEIKKKYGIPRKTEILYDNNDLPEYKPEEDIENFNLTAVFTKHGFFKKIPLTSLRSGENHLLKDEDYIVCRETSDNLKSVIFVSDKGQIYRARLCDFKSCKASDLGDYIPAKLGFDEGEKAVYMKIVDNYDDKHNMIYIFENGKGVKIPMSAYETKGNRKKLTGAYSTKSPLVAAFYETEPFNIAMISDAKRAILFSTKLIPVKPTRTAGGVTLFTLKKDQKIVSAFREADAPYDNIQKYRKIKLPAPGALLDEFDINAQQIRIDFKD